MAALEKFWSKCKKVGKKYWVGVGGIALVALLVSIWHVQEQRRATDIARQSGRAHVMFVGVTVHQPFALGMVFKAELVLKNSGGTPALGLVATGCMRPMPDLPDTLNCTPKPGDMVSQRDLSPGETTALAMTADAPTSALMLAHLRNGVIRWYMWGNVKYQDVFGERHVTTFCVQSDPRNPTMIVACPRHNESR